MKWVLSVAIIAAGIFSANAQYDSPVIKKYSKIHLDKKYIISETVFADGHIENYITSVPLSQLQNLRSNKNTSLSNTNIEWDEDLNKEGLQISFANAKAIQDAFNNAITKTEKELNYSDGSMSRISLTTNFLELNSEKQSQILIEKLSETLLFAENNIIDADKFSINKNMESSDAIFLTNNDGETSIPHIQAIYNWMFADQYTGWYNRTLLLNHETSISEIEKSKNKDIAYGNVVKEIIANPTFGKVSAVCFQTYQNKNQESYGIELYQDNTQSINIDGASQE